MLRKEQIDALLQEARNTHAATEAEREQLKSYLAQQTGEEMQKIVAQLDAIDVLVSDECEESISFTWRLKQRTVYELSDSFFVRIPKAAKKG